MSERHCTTCKYSERDSLLMPCAQCIDTKKDEFVYWEPKESPIMYDKTLSKNISMIKSIIDEAMEKRDRTVSVFISGENMHVTVAPLGADEPRWIPRKIEEDTFRYICPVCGEWEDFESRYCRTCGEALKRSEG